MLLLVAGCGGGGSGPGKVVPEVDRTPSAVSTLSTSRTDGDVTISWAAPALFYSGTIVRRGASGYPVSPTDSSSTLVCNVQATSCTDTGLDTGTYYYSAFAYGPDGDYSTAAQTSVTVSFEPFTLIVLPDTQYYSLDYPALFQTMTQWIVDSADELDIAYVLHEGDISHNHTEAEFSNAYDALSLLYNKVPLAMCIGNHDDGSGRDTDNFNKYFPISDFSSMPGFGGAYESDKMDNVYWTFSAAGTKWLVLSVEYDPREEVLAWADSIATANSQYRIILLTHAFMSPDDELWSVGDSIWDGFAKKYPNVTLAFNGHYTGDYNGRAILTGDNGNQVYSMFANYQTMVFGGLGYLRIVTLDRDNEKITVKTFSPYRNEYRTDDGEQFEYTGVNLDPM